MELKFDYQRQRELISDSFNRTFMELKLHGMFYIDVGRLF